MNDKDFNKHLLDIMEYAMGSEVMPGAVEQDRETENVNYSKTKTKGTASVTVSASANNMQELHDVLKLAGITLPKDDGAEVEAPDPYDKDDDDRCDVCDREIVDDECGCDDHDHSGEDPSYTTNKQAIIDRLRDTLKAKLIR